jgi:hypothetical protein
MGEFISIWGGWGLFGSATTLGVMLHKTCRRGTLYGPHPAIVPPGEEERRQSVTHEEEKSAASRSPNRTVASLLRHVSARAGMAVETAQLDAEGIRKWVAKWTFHGLST